MFLIKISIPFAAEAFAEQSSLQYCGDRGSNCGLSLPHRCRLSHSAIHDGEEEARDTRHIQPECSRIQQSAGGNGQRDEASTGGEINLIDRQSEGRC